MLEKSFCMIKPDGIARGLEKEIIGRIERSGLKITQKKIIRMDAEQSAALYQPHFGEKFYDGLIRFIISGPVAACVVEGERDCRPAPADGRNRPSQGGIGHDPRRPERAQLNQRIWDNQKSDPWVGFDRKRGT